MKPLVSIIVPVFNVQDYVLRCLESLVFQDYDNFEIIVIDDGSTDNSGELCDKFAMENNGIIVFHKKNGGLSSARNYGIKKAKGEYICFVDSDDYVKKDFVEKMISEVIRDSVDVVVCGYNNVIPGYEVMTGKESVVKLLTQQENIEILAWNKIYRKSLFDNILYPEGENYEDSLTTYKLLSKANKVAYIPESLYIYQERGGSIMKEGMKEDKLKVRERAAREAMNYFKKNSDLWEASEIALLTAKLAWVDSAINGGVKRKYFDDGKRWVSANKESLLSNHYLGMKLRMYVYMLTNLGGKLYVGFRKIKHE